MGAVMTEASLIDPAASRSRRPDIPASRDRVPAPAPAASPPAAAPAAAHVGAPALDFDSLLHAAEGRLTAGLSPSGLAMAYLDWATHLANAPHRRAELLRSAASHWLSLMQAAMDEEVIESGAGDHRFTDPAWHKPPFSLYRQAFLLAEDWWSEATAALPGVARRHERIVSFATRQLVDVFSPTNLPWLNPEVIDATVATLGTNFVEGMQNLVEDVAEASGGAPAGRNAYRVGRDLAVTPGKVVFRNALIELIQYAPTTAEVAREPVLVVPAWIMKYYILDLSPENSLIRHLVAAGHTVFAISWRNPGPEFRDTSFDDYRTAGVMTAIDVVCDICGSEKIQAAGYCLGGTLLAVAAATMARDADDRLSGVTLFCAQTDFSEAGELQLFVTEDQLAFLADVMRHQGTLDSRQMAGAFQLLRSNDLIWSRLVRSYLLGERDDPSDLMAWNADGTRMPARMHEEYLRRFFLDDELAEGHFKVEGKPVVVSDIRVPLFVVGTETDHVAPWRSVHKIHLLNNANLTFVLTSGGHNAGIVSEPGHPHRHFRIAERTAGSLYVGPDEWLNEAEQRDGSWWPAWFAWLDAHSTGRMAPPATGSDRYPPIEDAPGTYVHQH